MPEAKCGQLECRERLPLSAAIAVAVGAFFYFDLGRFLSLAALKDNRDTLLSFTEGILPQPQRCSSWSILP